MYTMICNTTSSSRSRVHIKQGKDLRGERPGEQRMQMACVRATLERGTATARTVVNTSVLPPRSSTSLQSPKLAQNNVFSLSKVATTTVNAVVPIFCTLRAGFRIRGPCVQHIGK